MSTAERRSNRLGALFVEVTGRSTVTERQLRDPGARVDEGEAAPVAAYVRAAARADGLDDAIDDPGPA